MARPALTTILLLLLAGAAIGGWTEDLDRLLALPHGDGGSALIESIVSEDPDWEDVAARIRAIRFDPLEKGDAFLRQTVCTDGKERPWVLVVPESYDPAKPTPLLVVLHGGVSRPTVPDDPFGYVRGNPFQALALEKGWLALFPFGDVDATWWNPVGMENILSLIRKVKHERNVDDDRVFMAGFSDGASAGFLFAMAAPTDFGAFVALNGHMGVGSLDGGVPTYAANFGNSAVYAVTTFGDPLYPSAKMRPMIEMARSAGGPLLYRELEGGHDFAYADTEIPRVAEFLDRHPRAPLSDRIDWETATGALGQCRWFAIDQVAAEPPAAWHRDLNLALEDSRVTIGFNHEAHEGNGVKVRMVVPETFAAEVGLLAGDIITGMNGHPVLDIDGLTEAKGEVSRGDEIELEVVRGEETLTLSGRLPLPETYMLFKREKPSARARVELAGNVVDVQASRLRAFRVLVHPDMVNLERPLRIRVNGRIVFEKLVEPDVGFMLRNYMKNRDRKLLFVAEIPVKQ